MDCKIVVMSREEVESYMPGEDEICISIRSHNPDYPAPCDSARKIVLSDKFKAVCHLQIDDIDPVRFPSHAEAVIDLSMIPMSAAQAEKVAAFTEEYIHSSKKLIVHCFAGISRSRSMAEAIRKRYHLPQLVFDVCNQYVYNMMMEAYKMPLLGA